MKALKSIGAVAAGFVAVFVLAILTDVVLVVVRVLPDPNQPQLYNNNFYMLIFAYTTLYSVVGGYLTAWLAPSKPILHAVILGVLGLLASSFGAYMNWGKATGYEWYPLALIVMAIPACWLGGMLFVRGKRAV